MFERIARIAGLCAFTTILSPASFISAAGQPPSGLSAATTVSTDSDLLGQGQYGLSSPGINAARTLTSGDGAGPSFCAAHGGYALGAEFDDVFACGSTRLRPDVFDTDGFQCVELSVRYLWVTTGRYLQYIPDGSQLVADASYQLGIPEGRPGIGSVPAPGDVVSLWGGRRAIPDGHTAVVTSVDVDSAGNGTITIMEENGLPNGWNQINVRDWKESYGYRDLYHGQYFYNHVRWLELESSGVTASPTPAAPAPSAPPPTSTDFTVKGLGPDSVATAINDWGTVAGVVRESSGGALVQRPFLYKNGSYRTPGYPGWSVSVTGINDHGALAASAVQTRSRPLIYALRRHDRFEWSRLPRRRHSGAAFHTTSIDPTGDVAGWQASTRVRGSSAGLVWLHRRGRYRIRRLHANNHFRDPIVNAADQWGDAIGSEKRHHSKTFATVWTPWRKAYRLPALSSTSRFSNAKEMIVERIAPGSRRLFIVGSSMNGNGVRQACEWTVSITPGRGISYSAAIDLASPSFPGPSTSVDINAYGSVVGKFWGTHGRSHVFLWRPSMGMQNLQRLLPPGTYWKLHSVAGIDSAGRIVGQARPARGRAPGQGVLITPPAS